MTSKSLRREGHQSSVCKQQQHGRRLSYLTHAQLLGKGLVSGSTHNCRLVPLSLPTLPNSRLGGSEASLNPPRLERVITAALKLRNVSSATGWMQVGAVESPSSWVDSPSSWRWRRSGRREGIGPCGMGTRKLLLRSSICVLAAPTERLAVGGGGLGECGVSCNSSFGWTTAWMPA